MTIDERRRHALHEHARRTWDEETAETLMELLPPVGWADVATKADLEALEERLTDRFEATLHRELRRQYGQIVGTVLGTVIPTTLTAVGLAFAAGRVA